MAQLTDIEVGVRMVPDGHIVWMLGMAKSWRGDSYRFLGGSVLSAILGTAVLATAVDVEGLIAGAGILAVSSLMGYMAWVARGHSRRIELEAIEAALLAD